MFYVLITLSTLGMLYAHRQYNVNGVIWGRPLAGLLGVLIVFLAGVKIILVVNDSSRSTRMVVKREQKYLDSMTEFLGAYIATNYPSGKILLITNPITEKNKRKHRRMVSLLENSFAGKATIIGTESPLRPRADAPNRRDDTLAGNNELTGLSFDLMVERHPQSNVVISFLDLPKDYHEMNFWSIAPERRPKLVVVLGNPYEFRSAIELNYISAIITYNPFYDNDLEKKTTEPYEELFHQRFLLINKENVQVIARDYPKMFKRDS